MKNNSTEHHIGSSFPIHHAPLIVDINTQRSYRKWGYVSWPTAVSRFTNNAAQKEEAKTILGSGGYVSWPENVKDK